MTKVQAKCMQVAIKAGNKKLMVKLALLANQEGGNQVYLPNAYDDVAEHVSKHEFAGFLSALQNDGFYRSQGDQFFGEVI